MGRLGAQRADRRLAILQSLRGQYPGPVRDDTPAFNTEPCCGDSKQFNPCKSCFSFGHHDPRRSAEPLGLERVPLRSSYDRESKEPIRDDALPVPEGPRLPPDARRPDGLVGHVEQAPPVQH